MTKKFAAGTGICVVAGISVVVFALTGCPKWTYAISILILLVGAGIQIGCFWRTRPST